MDEAGSASRGVEVRRRVDALGRLAGHLDGQIVVLDPWEGDPSTLREALATIVHAMQHAIRGFAPALLMVLLAPIDGERLNPMRALDLVGQLL